jgi:hypothetical protein
MDQYLLKPKICFYKYKIIIMILKFIFLLIFNLKKSHRIKLFRQIIQIKQIILIQHRQRMEQIQPMQFKTHNHNLYIKV